MYFIFKTHTALVIYLFLLIFNVLFKLKMKSRCQNHMILYLDASSPDE